jgi:hypothetical protein
MPSGTFDLDDSSVALASILFDLHSNHMSTSGATSLESGMRGQSLRLAHHWLWESAIMSKAILHQAQLDETVNRHKEPLQYTSCCSLRMRGHFQTARVL